MLALVLLAPASLSIQPVDISLQTFVLLVIAGVFRPGYSVSLVFIYILLGAIGLPVFSGYVGGFEKLTGPTAGFFVGFLLTTGLVSYLIPRISNSFWYYFIVFVLAHILIVIPGFIWLNFQVADIDLRAISLSLLPGLFIKSSGAAGVVYFIRSKLA